MHDLENKGIVGRKSKLGAKERVKETRSRAIQDSLCHDTERLHLDALWD
jgi:hypothetical protein